MPEVSSVPMDIVKVESEKGEAVTGRTPLGLKGMETKAHEVTAADDKNRAEDLIQKAAFMEAYAKHLTDKWIFHTPALNEEKERLERQLEAQAKQMSGKAFLMDLGDASNAGQPQREKGVPNADNVAQLALAHSVVAGALANKEELQDVQTGRLATRYGQLRERLETYVAGGKFTELETNTPTQVKEQTSTARPKQSAEKVATGSKVDENLGPLESQEERELVRDIQTALANGQASGFLHKRLEFNGNIKVASEGLQNFAHQNMDEKTAEELRAKLHHNFPHETYGSNAIHSGDSRLRLVTNLDSLPDPHHQYHQYEKVKPVRIGRNNVVLELNYYANAVDRCRRNGEFHMYLVVPRELGERVYASCEKHQQDDPTRAVKVLGHALGEDLDINLRDDKTGENKHAKLDVERVKLARS